MRTKLRALYISLIFTMMICFGAVTQSAAAAEYTVGEVTDLIDGIVSYKLNEAGAGDIQEWIDGGLSDGAGTTAEWYAITVSQMGGYDMSSYKRSLERYISENKAPSSATAREKIALALIASGSSDSFISRTIDDSIDELGLMSWIYGLHLLNNGFTGERYDIQGVTDTLLSMQFADGGWAIMGDRGDIDVTAMTINSLAPYYGSNGDVAAAVDRGLDFLSAKQLNNGGYTSFGTENPESTAQVLMAVSALGIDCQQDGRFVKDGNTLIDGIASFQLADGSFSHTPGGASNDGATMQSLYSLVAYRRMIEGGGPMFIMDRADPAENSIQEQIQPEEEQQSGHSEAAPQGEAPASTQASGHRAAAVSTTVSTAVTAAGSTSSSSASRSTASSSALTTAMVSAESTAHSTAVHPVTAAAAPAAGSISGGYKPIAIAAVWGIALLTGIVLYAAGKRNRKNLLAVAAAAAVCTVIVLFTDIQTKEQYYSGSSTADENAYGTVTLSIRCDTIVGKTDSEYVPADGVILDSAEFSISEGDTVFDVLTDAAKTYGIQVENSGGAGNAHGNVYISGINYLYELEYGDLSGWIYHVNGVSPSVNCGEYVLNDGDVIDWLYTCELGYDLEEE